MELQDAKERVESLYAENLMERRGRRSGGWGEHVAAVEYNRVMSREWTNTIVPFQCCDEPCCLSPLEAAALPLAGIRSKPHHKGGASVVAVTTFQPACSRSRGKGYVRK
jgi:hypothetical protein